MILECFFVMNEDVVVEILLIVSQVYRRIVIGMNVKF